MQLLTKEILALLPPLYANEQKSLEETLVPLKIFNPMGAGTWYITEIDPETKEAFGFAVLFEGEGELGYISIEELEGITLPLGLKIERDLHWDPKTTLAEVMRKEA